MKKKSCPNACPNRFVACKDGGITIGNGKEYILDVETDDNPSYYLQGKLDYAPKTDYHPSLQAPEQCLISVLIEEGFARSEAFLIKVTLLFGVNFIYL